MVITCSDSRSRQEDQTGKLIIHLLEKAGHAILAYRLVADEAPQIRSAIEEAVQLEGLQAVLINGGTGISPRDRTIEVLESLLEKHMEGFGELFRALSYEEIGPSAMLSRAHAGVYKGRVFFALPGSEAAVQLALQRLILPELGHIAYLLGT